MFNFTNVSWENSEIRDSDFQEAFMSKVKFKKIKLFKMNLSGVDFFNTTLKNIDLSNCLIKGISISDTHFELKGAKMSITQMVDIAKGLFQ